MGAARVLLVDDGTPADVFELIALGSDSVQARCAFLFEVGEELKLRIEADGRARDATARVLRHLDNGITELELIEQGEPRTLVSG